MLVLVIEQFIVYTSFYTCMLFEITPVTEQTIFAAVSLHLTWYKYSMLANNIASTRRMKHKIVCSLRTNNSISVFQKLV